MRNIRAFCLTVIISVLLSVVAPASSESGLFTPTGQTPAERTTRKQQAHERAEQDKRILKQMIKEKFRKMFNKKKNSTLTLPGGNQ